MRKNVVGFGRHGVSWVRTRTFSPNGTRGPGDHRGSSEAREPRRHVNVADVTADRQAQELAAEVVFESGADDLLAVVQVLGPDEADDRVGQQWLELACDRVGPRLERLLIDTMMGAGRECRALPGLEVHDIVADRSALERTRRIVGFAQQRQVDAEALVGLLGPGHRLKHQINRHTGFDHAHRVGHVREHATLRRDLVAFDHLGEHFHERAKHGRAVACRIDADDCVAAAVQQAVEHRCGDAAQIVGRVVGLQADRKSTRQTECVAKPCDDTALARYDNQVLVAHQLAHCRDHLGCEAGRQGGECIGRRMLRQQPVPPAANRQVRDRCEGGRIVRVDDQARHLVDLVGHDLLVQERSQGQIGERDARGHALFIRFGRDARELVAGALGRGLGEQRRQVGEAVHAVRDRVSVCHVSSLSGHRSKRRGEYTSSACATDRPASSSATSPAVTAASVSPRCPWPKASTTPGTPRARPITGTESGIDGRNPIHREVGSGNDPKSVRAPRSS
nr:hypothetical protein [uncultured bacterium]